MRFDVITLFPELFAPHLDARRDAARLRVAARSTCSSGRCATSPTTPHRRVDDRPYGGGPGMVMLVEPLSARWRRSAPTRAEATPAPLVHFTPDRAAASTRRWCASSPPGAGAVLLCGRYEGIDQRFIDRHVDLELSLGDFVLSGGEIAGAGAARCGRAPAAGRARRRAVAPAGQLLRRPARLPALQPARGAARRRRATRRAGGAAVGPPRRDRALAARAVARADRPAPARPDRRGARRRPARRRPTRRYLARACSYNHGFSILCQRAAPIERPHHTFNKRWHDRQEKPVDLIQTLEQEEIARLNKTIPAVRARRHRDRQRQRRRRHAQARAGLTKASSSPSATAA